MTWMTIGDASNRRPLQGRARRCRSHSAKMVDAMRAMLDELMGKERNVPLTQRSNKKINWDDSHVCKYQLCGLCPPRLFKNTKSAMGEHIAICMLFMCSEWSLLTEWKLP
jgi:hypothetical protein